MLDFLHYNRPRPQHTEAVAARHVHDRSQLIFSSLTLTVPFASNLSPRFAFAYGEFVVLWVVFYTGNFVVTNAVIYSLLTVIAIWAHLKTMLSNPGVVPRAAMPLREEEVEGSGGANHTLCGRCESFKPVR